MWRTRTKKHAVINEDGSGSIDIAAGNNEYLPKKAEQLGYLLAHVEAFIGMQAVSFSEDKCKIYLDISDVQLNQLKRMKCHYKFRIFSDTITFFVRETAVKFFTIGFEKAWSEISERMESDGIIESYQIRVAGTTKVKEEIHSFLPENLYLEYCDLYAGTL